MVCTQMLQCHEANEHVGGVKGHMNTRSGASLSAGSMCGRMHTQYARLLGSDVHLLSLGSQAVTHAPTSKAAA